MVLMSSRAALTTSLLWISQGVLLQPCNAQLPTIYQLAKDIPENLLTFTTALDLAGLDINGYLNDDASGPFTALAPNNEAFESISGIYLEPEWKNYLLALVEYHIMAGSFPATSLSQNLTIPSRFDGKEVTVTESDPITFNEEAMIVNGNLDASNGLVHVINTLLLPPSAGTSLLDQAAANPEMSRFVELVTSLGLTETLAGAGPWTLLIPTNDAFAKVPSSILSSLDDNARRQIVLFHVLPEIQMAYQLDSDTTVMTMHNTSLQLSRAGIVGGADFTSDKDVMASNGVWHAIDSLLLPIEPSDVGDGDTPTSSPLDVTPTSAPDDGQPTSVPVPVDALPTSIPVNEPVPTSLPVEMPTSSPGDAPTSVPSDTQPTSVPVDEPVPTRSPGDIPAEQPAEIPTDEPMTTTPLGTTKPTSNTIFQAASNEETLSEFIDAVVLADLDVALDSPGPFTVWAPMNDAFGGMPLKLYEPAWKFHLSAVLEYHVTPLQEVPTTELAQDGIIPTVEGSDIEVTSVSPFTLNGNARIITADVSTSNGILHTINSLLLPPYVSNTVAQVSAGDDDLTEFTSFLDDNDLLSTLDGEGPFTLLAPVNSAFEKYPISAIMGSLDSDGKQDILAYHIIPQLINSEMMTSGASFVTRSGREVKIMNVDVMDNNQIRVNDASVIETNVLANNGIIHYIDTVLIPDLSTDAPTMTPAITDSPSSTSNTTNAPTKAPAASTMAPTMMGTATAAPTMAPSGMGNTTDAPTKSPVVSTMGPTMVSNATTGPTMAPSRMDNTTGTPTMPPIVSTMAPTRLPNDTMAPTTAVTPAGSETLMSIAEIANANSDFSVLAAAINATGLFGVLDSPQSILTVFAPTDAAFTASPLNLTQFLEPQWQAHLSSILMYHLLAGAKVLSSQLLENMTAATLEGSSITVTSVGNGTISINGVSIETPDLEASNGIVHVLDEQMLLPPSATDDIVQIASTKPTLSSVVALLEQSNLDLSEGGPFTFFAPTNSILDSLPSAMFAALGADGLTEVLGFHVVPGRIYLEDDLLPGLSLTTQQGDEIVIGSDSTSFNILNSNILGSNGVIHEIDNLLIPVVEDASEAPTQAPAPSTLAPSMAITAIATGTPSISSSEEGSTSVPSVGTTMVPSAVPSIALTEGPSETPIALPTVSELLSTDDQFSALAQLLGVSGVDATLGTNGPFTVFAPNNAAFDDVPTFILATLTGESLFQTLSYHVVSGLYSSGDLVDGMVLPTLQGGNITIAIVGGNVSVIDDGGNTMQVTMTDYMGKNGVIHEVDGVLFPILSTDGPTMTPSQAPPTSSPSMNAATTVPVTEAPSLDAAGLPTEVPTETLTVVEVIGNIDSLSNLTALLGEYGLDTDLSALGPFTVFAPIDAAFQALPQGFLTSLLPEQVTDLLSYHVVPGTYLLSDLAEGVELQTLRGSNLTFNNASQWISGDLSASNGVVHLIGDVLFAPSPPTAAPTSFATEMLSPNTTSFCDEGMLAYAAVCCPVENAAFENFCKDLFDRNEEGAETPTPDDEQSLLESLLP